MAKKTVHVVYVVNDKALKQADQSIIKLGNDAFAAQKKMNSMGKEGEGAGKKITGAFTSLKGIIATLGLVALAKQIFNVTAEFQKLEAVLANSLGGQSAARAAIKVLQEFAAKTPFSVRELTASYLKLVNQGFKPTVEQLRQLGDLAASTGKDFDQLTEAIIDAQTGEFERLKEFGIRAKKEGDKVTFTFKGIQTQVKFTGEEIRKYITSLGDLEGVSGSMAAISATLEGKVSNLGDAFDNLFNQVGKLNDGPLAQLIDLLSKGVAATADWIAVANMDALDFAEIRLKRFRDAVEEANAALLAGDATKANQIYIDMTNAINEASEELKELEADQKLAASISEEAARKNQLMIDITKAEIQGYKDLRAQVLKTVDTVNLKEAERLKALQKIAAEEARMIREMLARIAAQRYQIESGKMFIDQLQQINKEQSNIAANFEITERAKKRLREQEVKDAQWVREELKRIEDQKVNDAAAAQERRNQILMAGLDTAAQILSLMVGYREEDTSAQEEYYRRQIELAGDNDRKRTELEKKQRALKDKADKKESEARRSAAIKQILIDTAMNVVRSITNNGGIPLGLPFGALALALGIAQVATVRKYAKGEVDIKGPGTGTSDSINARLSKGETITTAARTKESKGLLTMIRDGKINDKTMRSATGRMPVAQQFNDKNIVKAIEDNKAPDYVRIADDLYEVKQAKNKTKTLIRKKHFPR